MISEHTWGGKSLLLLLVLSSRGLGAAETTSAAGSNETDLATSRGVSAHSGGVANMLMVTTTMGMLDGVHGHTTDLRPAVTLHLVLVVRTTSLQHGLVDTTTTGHNAYHGAVGRWDDLLRTRGQLDTGFLCVGIVRDYGGIIARRLGNAAAITSLLLKRAYDGSLRHGAHGKDISYQQISFLARVDELARVHALRGYQRLRAQLVAVRVAEAHLGQGRTTAGVVDDVLDDALNVTMALSVVHSTQARCALASVGVRLEHTPGSLTLRSDYTTHFIRK